MPVALCGGVRSGAKLSAHVNGPVQARALRFVETGDRNHLAWPLLLSHSCNKIGDVAVAGAGVRTHHTEVGGYTNRRRAYLSPHFALAMPAALAKEHVVIHFRCPLCGKGLKAAEDRAGTPVACPRCKELFVIPAAGHAPENGGDDEAAAPPRHADADEAPGLFSGMSRRVRWAAGSLAAGVPLGLLLAAAHDFLPGGISSVVAHVAMTSAVVSFLLLCAVLYGQGTSCPSCGKWWSRAKLGKEFVDREVLEKENTCVAKSLYRTTYRCESCGHRWRVSEAEEYQMSAPAHPQRHRR
jgi:phage FluMu protein Com